MSGTVKRHILFLSLLLPAFVAPAQDDDYSWWNNRHGWDGYSSWTKYLTYSAACFGPNALPVPEIRDALIGSRASLEARADLHFSRGDDTQNLFMKFRYPFLDGRVAVEAYGVPIEHYVLDTVTRDERAARSRDPRGFVAGDIWFGTLIQLLRDHAGWPDLLLGLSFRAPSGGGLGDARYTDAPGYYFDLSAGKSFKAGAKLMLRPHAMLGFYVWQTNIDINPQNDAFLYGAGLSVYNDHFECNARWGGYLGYLNNGDAPMVVRANTIWKLQYTHLKLSFQQGLHDFGYTTVSVGAVFWLTKE